MTKKLKIADLPEFDLAEHLPDEQAQAAPEAQQNTSPAFPPVPDNGTSPMQGIETPETADNLPQGVEQ